MSDTARLGRALRAIRQENGWSLTDVADRTGVSISTLSKVENNRLSLTYGKLMNLSEGLGVDISRFFADDEAAPNGATARRSLDSVAGGRLMETDNYLHRYLNAELSNKRLVPVVVEHKARTMDEFGDLVRHDGEEFLFVLSGEIEVHTEHYEPIRLKAGQSIYLDSTMGHAYLAVGDETPRTLSVCTPPLN